MAHENLKLGLTSAAVTAVSGASPALAAQPASATVVGVLGAGLIAALVAAALLWSRLRAARASLAAAEGSARALVDSSPAGLIRLAGDRGYASSRAAELLGLDDIVGDADSLDLAKRLVSSFAKDDSAAVKAALESLRTEGRNFEESGATTAGRTVKLCGRRAGDVSLVWLTDASDNASQAAQLAHQKEETAALRELLDALPLPVWWRDSENALAGCNKAYAEACGEEPDTVLKERRELGAGYIDRGGLALAERAAQTRMRQSESHHVVVGGARRMLEFNESPLTSSRGGSVGFATDATALEALQDQLADHIAAHAEVLEGLSTAIAIYGADKRLKFFNTAYAALTGIDQDMLQGEPSMSEILEWQRERRRLPEYADFPAFKQERDRWFTSLIEPDTELMHLPDDTTIRAVASPHPLGGLIFALEDVTDRLALESSYNTLIEVQRETLNKLHEGIAVFGGDGRLKLSNPELTRVWRLSDEQLDGGPHISDLVEATREFFSKELDWAVFKQRLILMVTERAVRSGRLRRADGSVVRYASVPLPDGNTLLSFLDVSDSDRVERALRERNVALEHADRIKSEFIGNVSYELRTPLNAIVGFTEILDNRYFGELTERQSEYVECILQASTHLMTLIDDILDLATIEADFMTLDLQPVDVREILDRLIEIAGERADQAGLRIEIDCPDDIGALTADPVRLRQALFNLISNAIQFTPAGGVISLAARRENEEMLLTVSDTGIGIALEDQERVFENFERIDPYARESGTGLGLALVKSLIELHGGTVELDSEPGRGTSALCRLPTGAGADESDTPAKIPEKPASPKKTKKTRKSA